MEKATSALLAMASRCKTVLVEPPMAISRVIEFKKAERVAIFRGSTDPSSLLYQASAISTIRFAARSKSCRRLLWVATMVPFPGSARPKASFSEFMEFAVNIPEQEPQVGQAQRSTIATSSSLTSRSAPITMASTRS